MGVPCSTNMRDKMCFIGESVIKFVGLNSMKTSNKAPNAGSFRFECDYLFKIYDETYEFVEHQYYALEESTRHKGDRQPFYLTINCCNP